MTLAYLLVQILPALLRLLFQYTTANHAIVIAAIPHPPRLVEGLAFGDLNRAVI